MGTLTRKGKEATLMAPSSKWIPKSPAPPSPPPPPNSKTIVFLLSVYQVSLGNAIADGRVWFILFGVVGSSYSEGAMSVGFLSILILWAKLILRGGHF